VSGSVCPAFAVGFYLLSGLLEGLSRRWQLEISGLLCCGCIAVVLVVIAADLRFSAY